MILFSEKVSEEESREVDPSSSTPLLPPSNTSSVSSHNGSPRSLLHSYLRRHPTPPTDYQTAQTTSLNFKKMMLKTDPPPSYIASTSDMTEVGHPTSEDVSKTVQVDERRDYGTEQSPSYPVAGTSLQPAMSPYTHTGNNFLAVCRTTSIQGHWTVNTCLSFHPTSISSATADNTVFERPNLTLETSRGDIEATLSVVGHSSKSSRCVIHAITKKGAVNVNFKDRSNHRLTPLSLKITSSSGGAAIVKLPPHFHGVLKLTSREPRRYWDNTILISPVVQKRTKFVSTNTVDRRMSDCFFVSAEDAEGPQSLTPEEVEDWMGDVIEAEAADSQVMIYDHGERIETSWVQSCWKLCRSIGFC